MQAVTIRTASPADLATVLRFQQAIVDAERPFDPTLRDSDVRYYDIERLLRGEDAHMVIAEANGEPIGCGFARIEAAKPYLKHAQHAYLGLMCVRDDHRGRGVNQLIIDALKAWCRSRRVAELRLDVYCGNAPAIRAYEKAGFEQHLVQMRLSLDA